ncbi:hypothetical protein [Bacillus thuringiensis]
MKEKSLSVPERGEQIPDENKKAGKEKTNKNIREEKEEEIRRTNKQKIKNIGG